MDVKRPLPSTEFTTDVAPLPSAPPPSYEDACATASNVYSGASAQQPSLPLITETSQSAAPASSGSAPYPVQQVQITPAVITASGNRILPVGRQPLKTTCPVCNIFISTKIRVKNRFSSTFWCFVLCLTCVCLPCSCCPYFCCDDPLKVEHFCPRCNAFLGSYVDRRR